MTGKSTNRWGIIGHDRIVRLLQRFVERDSIPHAILLLGPQGIGKSTIARKWAAAVNCLADDPADRPCGACRSCNLVAANRHPDLIWMQPKKGVWRIDQVRELERNLMLSPVEGRHRIAVLEDFDLATPAAANAILKTLEEPAPHALLVLTASDETHLLPTIVSRCHVLKLHPAPEDEIERGLVAVGVDAGKAKLYARISGGRPGLAFRMYLEPDILAKRESFWRDFLDMLRSGYAERMLYASRLSKDQTLVQTWFDHWSGWWRDLTLIQEETPESIVNVDLMQELERIANGIHPGAAVSYLERLQRGFSMWRSNVNTRLLLEDLLLQMPVISV